MLFGLGGGELLLMLGVIALIAGPAAIPKALRFAKKAHTAKSEVTSGRALRRLVEEPERTERDDDERS